MGLERKFFAADDWGLSPGINMGILALAKAGLLRSISCMANTPFLEHGLPELLSFSGLEFWMHFNLTYGTSMLDRATSLAPKDSKQFYPHKAFLLNALCGRLKRFDIQAEFEAQLAALLERNIPVMGVNGHHHVHLWPAVFDAIRPVSVAGKKTKLRLMRDRLHPATFSQTRYFRLVRPRAGEVYDLEECHYLLKRDWSSSEALNGKVKAAAGAPLLAHPALYNDFLQAKMTDSLQDERVAELKSVLEFLS
jgi:predicted glycoside hydrolase/deacetylase ChbG (UPF0249 family)